MALVKTAEQRFWAKVDKSDLDGCWPWTGSIQHKGYAEFNAGRRKKVRGHRWLYQLAVGPIPDGMVLDHTCHTESSGCPGGKECLHRRCVNPAHLEAVTNKENLARGIYKGTWERCPPRGQRIGVLKQPKAECKSGHPFDEANTRHYIRDGQPRRACRACERSRWIPRSPHTNTSLLLARC